MWQHFLQYCVTHCTELNSNNFGAEDDSYTTDNSPINQFTGEKRLDVFALISNGVSPVKSIESGSALYKTEYPSLSSKILTPSPLKSSAAVFVNSNNKNTSLCIPCTNCTVDISSSSIDDSTSTASNFMFSKFGGSTEENQKESIIGTNGLVSF
jgi:hypothetical protein